MKKLSRTHIVNVALWILLTVMISPSMAQNDYEINTDLIVYGSECIGVDCVYNQPFNYSTLILKENNLRIFLDDTSASASFSGNDWEIIANDTVNGGQSFLGFADRGVGQASVSGQGICSGGLRDGQICGTGVFGEDCPGVCEGASMPCVGPYAQFCTDNGGTCVNGICEGANIPCSGPNDRFCTDIGGTCVGVGECVPPGAIIFRIEAGGPEDSLVIDSAGDVKIAGNLTVDGTINGDGGNSSEIEELREEIGSLQEEIGNLRGEIDSLKAQMEMLLSLPGIQEIEELQGKVDALKAQMEMVLSVPAIQGYINSWHGHGH